MAHRFLTAAELRARWGAEQVERLAAAAPGGIGGSSATIDAAIDAAEAEALARLLPRYRREGVDQLPTDPADAPLPLKNGVADIAIYHLARPAARISEAIQRAYDNAVRFFAAVGRGQADLGLAAAPEVDRSTPQILATKSAADMVFGNGGLDEW